MGKFIVFEGIDGSGKSTQIRMLAERLAKSGEKVSLSAEPTSTTSGGLLRDALSGEMNRSTCELAALFVWDRIHHNINKTNGIEKLLSDGYTVISDRYYYSSLAYQGEATDYEWVKNMNLSCPEIRKPDMCIFIDISPDEAIRRINADRSSKEIYETKDKLTKTRDKFMKVFSDLKDDNIIIFDGSKSIDVLSDEIFKVVTSLIALSE